MLRAVVCVPSAQGYIEQLLGVLWLTKSRNAVYTATLKLAVRVTSVKSRRHSSVSKA